MNDQQLFQDAGLATRLLELYRLMVRIRLFESMCMDMRASGKVLGNTFPSVGQEAFCAVGLALADEDVVFPSYRSRPLFFGKGVTVAEHLRELLGAPNCLLGGREVFHHAAWPGKGVMPSSSMIGGWVPMAAGYALAQRLDGAAGMTVCAMGDGILGAGDLHEAWNLIGLWNLPVLMICENNGYQVSAPWQTMRKQRSLGEYAKPFGIAVLEADGNDPLALYEVTRQARETVMAGTPVLIDCFTYRFGGYSSHIGEPRRGHEEEMLSWRPRDPLNTTRARLAELGTAGPDVFTDIEETEKAALHTSLDAVMAESLSEGRA